jgi:glycosyltransferase involved in cell wall biosynthesis
MKVRIGITTRNRATLLSKAIQSAVDQDYANKEIAVFDDASTDETPQMKARFPEVRWYRTEEQRGILVARNELMRDTDAVFFFSLDDDAWFVKGDEISEGVRLMQQQSEVAALAYDILSPDRPLEATRSTPRKTHLFIGCGHMLRLSAVKDVGYYTPSPGFYGSEEKDLCVRLLERGCEIMFLTGVHVWHDKTTQARDTSAQIVSGVCNDLVFAFRRCPYPMMLWVVPGKMFSNLRFGLAHKTFRSCLKGVRMFIGAIPNLGRTRSPVSKATFREFLRRQRANA